MSDKPGLATAFISLLLFSGLVGVQFVSLTAANFGPLPAAHAIYIRSDGSIDPSTAPIKRVEDVYTFMGSMLLSTDHYHFIEIQRDNIVVDGAGYILESYGHNGNSGIKLEDRSNVTIKNIEIRQFQWGITLLSSSNNTITRNNIVNNAGGIKLHGSSNNIVTENNIGNNYYLGIQIYSSNYNHIVGNNIILYRNFSWMHGIEFRSSSNNVIAGNNIINHENGIGFRSSSNNIFHHNNFINNQKQVDDDYFDAGYREWYPSMVLSVNIWDNGAEGNYWSDCNGTDNNGDGIGDTPYIINERNQDNYPLINPVVIPEFPVEENPSTPPIQPPTEPIAETPMEAPTEENATIPPTDPSPTSQLPPSPPFIAMPEEYINYTISRVNGSLWAKIDGKYPLYVSYEKSGSDDLSKLDDTSLLVTSDELPMFYPTPPGTTDISVKMNETELNWSNYTKTHPEATHHTAIGDWPMIYCTIQPVPDHFILKIHYEHPIILMNGSYTFLYDLNISPYLSPWCNKSTAYFNIRMETKYEDFNVYTTGSEEWNPVNYTLTKENTAEIVSIKIISEYDKPLLGDLAVTFTDAKASSLIDYSYVIIAVIGVAIASVAGYQFLKRIDMRFNDKHLRARCAAVKTFAAVSVLLFSIVAGTLLIDVGTANPLPTTSTISVISPQQNKVYTVNNVPLTLSNTIEIAGTFPIGKQLIKYYLDGELKGQIESELTRDSPTETFSFNLTGLSDGLHCITVSVHGGYSNSFLEIVYFTVDTTPPRISVLAPLDRTYNATEVPLNFIVREPVSWMGYSLDGQVNVTISGNTTLSELSYGSHNLTGYANDIAGNMGYSRTIYFSIAQKKEPKQPETEQSEPFPTWIIATIVIVAVVGATLLVYLRKIRKTTGKIEIISEGVV